MLPTHLPHALRRTCQVLLLLFGVMLAVAPRQAVAVCTGDCCSTAASCCEDSGRSAQHDAGCPCCRPAAGAASEVEGDDGGDAPHVRATCKPGCCISLVYDVELQLDGRVPTNDLPLASAGATPLPAAIEPPATRPCVQPPDRGPPRIDERAGRRRCTVLLI